MLKSAARLSPPPPPRYIVLGIAILLLVAGAAGITLNLTLAQAANGVYDTDGDKLIEIDNLEQLDAVRYDKNGDGKADSASNNASYAAAFPVSGGGQVCNTGCKGYELKRSLDFDSADSYASGTVNSDWVSGSGWAPMRGEALFNGNGNTISNLYINRTETRVGLFDFTTSTATIRGIGLLNVDVTGRHLVGALVAQNSGTVSHSYATGDVKDDGMAGEVPTPSRVGGLVGYNDGKITVSYATSSVEGWGSVGGLVGQTNTGISSSYATGAVSGTNHGVHSVGGLVGESGGGISSSYAIGAVSGEYTVGGLVGRSVGTLSNSYWNTDVTTVGVGEGSSDGAEGKTTAELKAPTARRGIYANWNLQHWDFGTSSQYPLLKGDIDGDGKITWQEFGPQIEGDRPEATPTPTVTNTPMPTATPASKPTATHTPTPEAAQATQPTATPTATPRPPTPTPTPTPAPVLTSGYNSSCLLDSDGTASCWDSRTKDLGAPPAGAKFTAISSGYGHTCGLKTDGTIACWGSDSQGESTPPSGKFTAISSGFTHTCALRTDGTATCWGNNRSGQAEPPEDTPFTAINSGLTHTCGQRVDGVVVCWGGLSGTFGE